MTDGDPGEPLDVPTLEVLGRRAVTHPLVTEWSFRPDALSPRRLELRLDADQYPESVESARLDVRWFEGGEYAVHYLEERNGDTWQCRWDRHPKPDGPTAHFHPPPDASGDVKESDFGDHHVGDHHVGDHHDGTHHLGVLFATLDWIEARVAALHDDA